jgi:hypothetical protein
MFLALKSSISNISPLAYPFIFLSIPDTIRHSSYNSCNRFQLAAQQAGFELLRTCTSASRSTLYYHYIEDCFHDVYPGDKLCRPDVKTPLTISYIASSLAGARFTREDGMLEISREAVDLDLGALSALRREDEVKYWAEVKEFIGDVVDGGEVDALFLLGEDNMDDKFRGVVKEILREGATGKTFEELVGVVEKDMGDGLSHGARGAAVIARRLMWYGEDACLPNAWCEIASYHDEL